MIVLYRRASLSRLLSLLAVLRALKPSRCITRAWVTCTFSLMLPAMSSLPSPPRDLPYPVTQRRILLQRRAHQQIGFLCHHLPGTRRSLRISIGPSQNRMEYLPLSQLRHLQRSIPVAYDLDRWSVLHIHTRIRRTVSSATRIPPVLSSLSCGFCSAALLQEDETRCRYFSNRIPK